MPEVSVISNGACIDMNDALARERYLKIGPVRNKTPKVSVPISANISNGAGMGKRYLKNRMKRFLSLTGQALLELAIFGSILIMLLGVLINYGLKYNYQQQVMQQTYRKALKGAADSAADGKPMSVTYVLARDKYIPNPSQLFGLGLVTPISASAGVIRNYHMQDSPVTKDELPQVTVDING